MGKEVTPITSMTDLQAEIAGSYGDIAKEISKQVSAGGGNAIRVTQDKHFEFPNGDRTKGPFRAVILGFESRNVYYEANYNANKITPPECYAQGSSPHGLVPPADVLQKQADECDECPNNQYGSRGNGKACSNQRIIALLPPDDVAGDIVTLKVSPTGLRDFDTYVSKLATVYNVPPFAVTTEISFDENSTYPKLTFKSPVPNTDFKAFGDRAKEVAVAVAPVFNA